MIFKGQYINKVFIPEQGSENRYYDFIRKIEDNKINIQIEIKKKESYSESQAGLLSVLISKVAEKTGHTYSEVALSLTHLRNNLDKDYSDYTTSEMNAFIENAIMFLNDFFDMRIEIENNNGKANIKIHEY